MLNNHGAYLLPQNPKPFVPSPAQAADAEEENDDAEPRQPAEKRIRNRSDLHREYAGFSRSELCHEFLLDDNLQKRIRLLVDVTEPLHREFVTHLDEHKAGADGMLKWHAQRSTGAFVNQTICETLTLLSQDFMCDRRDIFEDKHGLVKAFPTSLFNKPTAGLNHPQ